MSILMINTIDNKGGAAKVAYRLNNSLLSSGQKSSMLVGRKYSSADSVREFEYPDFLFKAPHPDNWRGFFLQTYQQFAKTIIGKHTTLVHLHNAHGGYVNMLQLRRLLSYRPTIWTLHDTWLIQEKGMTPQYDATFQGVPSYIHFIKSWVVRRTLDNVVFTTPSLWLRDLVKSSYPALDVRYIPNGIDTNTFRPSDKDEAKKALGLPLNKKIVLFVADDGDANPSKGGEYLTGYRQIMEDDVDILIIGSKENYVKDENTLALYYAAADVFAFPSLAENLPLVVMEAMACGTPVVAFKVGGIPEQIDHMVNGYIAEYKNGEDFNEGINTLLNLKNYKKICKNARRKVLDIYDADKIFHQYTDLYNEVLGR